MSITGQEHVNNWVEHFSGMAPKKNYKPEQMAAALGALERGINVSAAAKEFNVPRVTLLYKWKGNSPRECSMGPSTTLTALEENILVQWIIAISKLHYPITKDQLLDSVEYIIKETNRKNSFINGRPGEKWYKLFLKRHPELSERISQNLTTSRESVTEIQIRNWFTEIKEYLLSKNLYQLTSQPERVFNADEAAFFLQPKGERVIVKKGEKNVYFAGNKDEKENLTVLVTANAAGTIAPPMVVFSYARIPSHIANSIPSTWAIGRSENGWMCGATFFEYITNIFLPWLKNENIERPILFFVDGHVSHMTHHLSKFCSANGIELFALFPNSTHLLQPMDVAVFRPLKNAWKKEVRNWRMENSGNKFQKHNFGNVFKKCLTTISHETLKNGFRRCGLCPFNVDNVNFEKVSSRNLENKQNPENIRPIGLLTELENRIGKNKVMIFKRNLNKDKWEGTVEDTSLFKIWKDLTQENIQEIIIRAEEQDENERETGKNTNNGEEHETVEVNQDGECLTNENGDSNTTEATCESICTNRLEQSFKTPLKDVINEQSLIKSPSTVVTQSSIPLDVPSPFKRALFWPEPEVSTRKRRSKEKIPSVITSAAWQEYHTRKENEKKKKQEEKEQKARVRAEKKAEREKVKIDSESSNEEEWTDSGDSLDDVTISEEKEYCELDVMNNVSAGDYVLVKFFGGKRKTTQYRYVCVVQNVLHEENEIEVMSMKVSNTEKDVFTVDDSDVSLVEMSAIIGKLPFPEILVIGDRVKYQFPKPVDVFEST